MFDLVRTEVKFSTNFTRHVKFQAKLGAVLFEIFAFYE